MDNDALDSVDQFESAVIASLDWLCGLAPAAVQNGVGRGYPRCRRRILRPHDANKDIERGPGMASRQRADFGDGFGHRELCFLVARMSEAKSGDKRNTNPPVHLLLAMTRNISRGDVST